jgi:hypothetical protein
MRAPVAKQTPEAFNEAIIEWLDSATTPRAVMMVHEEPVIERACRMCGATIQWARAYVSVHEEMFGPGCVGWGECHVVSVPYCPVCEPDGGADKYTCVHVCGNSPRSARSESVPHQLLVVPGDSAPRPRWIAASIIALALIPVSAFLIVRALLGWL